MDGKAFRPDGKTAAVLIPPAYGLAGVNLHTWTGWGSVTYWNAFVANLEMHGKGTFYDPRLDDPVRFPIAAANHFGSGWAWLVQKKDGSLDVVSTHDAATPMTEGLKPLLTCDVWEHAYYIDYRNARPKYVEAWWNLVSWDHAAAKL